jgi:hypothetical protein
LSTITGDLNDAYRRSATTRATRSVFPPAGNGTTICIDSLGYSAAATGGDAMLKTPKTIANRTE